MYHMQIDNLFLIPTVIAAETQEEVIPSEVRTRLREINDFLVEDIRTARRYLSSLRIFDAIERLSFNVLNKDTKATELATLFQPIFFWQAPGRPFGVGVSGHRRSGGFSRRLCPPA